MINIVLEMNQVDAYMMHRADGRSVTVRIVHRPEDGYRLSHDGEVIKEQLNLQEFVQRLVDIEHKNKALTYPIHEYVDRHIREILSALDQGGQKLNAILNHLDEKYAHYIGIGKAVLIEHTHSINVRRVDPQSHRAMEHVREENMHIYDKPMTPDEAFRVSDDEIYYSMTP